MKHRPTGVGIAAVVAAVVVACGMPAQQYRPSESIPKTFISTRVSSDGFEITRDGVKHKVGFDLSGAATVFDPGTPYHDLAAQAEQDAGTGKWLALLGMLVAGGSVGAALATGGIEKFDGRGAGLLGATLAGAAIAQAGVYLSRRGAMRFVDGAAMFNDARWKSMTCQERSADSSTEPLPDSPTP